MVAFITMREPAVAGMFYPARKSLLVSDLTNCFKMGPGPLKRDDTGGERTLGLVSPHAGYTYSGQTAAFGFAELNRGGLPETVIVLGPNHHGWGAPISVSTEDWKMPMGTIQCDTELARELGLEIDESAHQQEHSLEVQVPFLQYLDPNVKMVGIEMLDQSLDISQKVGKNIARAIQGSDRTVSVIASSDMTHCGRNYGVPVPEGMNAGEYARSIDIPVIEKLLKWDLKGAFRIRSELGVTACGMGPIAAMITAVKDLGGRKSRLLSYTTSYDVQASHSAVGYVSLAFY